MNSLWRRAWIGVAWRVALPAAWWWVRGHQRRILREGRPLSRTERSIAVQLGIERDEAVRVLAVDAVPTPGGALLGTLGRLAGVSAHGAKGMALDHGIYLETAQADRTTLVAHELAHVAQYERLGGSWNFLRDYLRQCLHDGYWNAPLEIEARERAAEFGDVRPE